MLFRILIIALALTAVAGCSKKRDDLRSPCVGAEGSPCEKRPVNVNWQA